MNFLAHIYLSFDDPEITLGNFFADHIRGNKYKHLPNKVQKGILLHRAIDSLYRFASYSKTEQQTTSQKHIVITAG